MKPLRLLVPAFISGLMLALAWLGFSGLILLIAFVPLLYAEELLLQNHNQGKPTLFWAISFFSFFVWNVLTSWWIWHATPVGAFVTIVLNSLMMSMVWGLAFKVSQRKGTLFGHVFLLFAWISFEYLHYRWDMSWPWLTLGNGLANDVKLVQWFEYTGVFGGTAWILVVNLLLFDTMKRVGDVSGKSSLVRFGILFFVIAFPVCFSLLQYANYTEKTDPVDVVIAQPNIDPYHDKFGGMTYNEQLDRLLRVSDSLGSPSVDFFIGPETALHEVWENDPHQSPQISSLSRFIDQKYPYAAYIVGATTFLRYFPGDVVSPTARHSADSAIVYDAFNSSCFIKKDQPVQLYHKTKLVSGVEKMPFEKHLRFLKSLMVDLGGISGTLGTLGDTVVFKHDRAVVAVPICYESGYGEYLTGFVMKGATVFFVITNDGWWRDTPGYKQHLSFSRLRAIELRRSIARSANTGISCFINQRGDILDKSDWWKTTALSGTLNLNDKITFYARHGDFIARFSVFMFALLLLVYFSSFVIAVSHQVLCRTSR
jgi:apolipoprotein N-acyltransferase